MYFLHCSESHGQIALVFIHAAAGFYFILQEKHMQKSRSEDPDDMLYAAHARGVRYPVRLSAELSELLKPNEFLEGLGITFSERLNAVLSVLKGNMVPKDGGPEEAVPGGGTVFPLALAKGPYIREELISIKAELTDDDGKVEIVLSAIPEQEH
jgi:hypothetical protein